MGASFIPLVPNFPQHEKLADIAEDLIPRLFEESKIPSAAVARARLHVASLRDSIKRPDLTASDLVVLVDLSDCLIDFVATHTESLCPDDQLAFRELQGDLTGIPRGAAIDPETKESEAAT